MEFHLSLEPDALPVKIDLRDPIFLSGSCFTEHMTARFRHFKFQVLDNPHGIIFNPVSLAQSIRDILNGRMYSTDDLFERNGIWSSWDFHSRFSATDPEQAVAGMNHSVSTAKSFMSRAGWALLTLGSAFVYCLKDQGRVVANCHKEPSGSFTKRLLTTDETVAALDGLIRDLYQFNPSLRLILTVSPVRHLRDGFVANNRSKARLIESVHQLTERFSHVYYFPAYELIIDDLRDYRFYAEDMVHPNYQATAYVWEKFAVSSISGSSREVMKDIQAIRSAMAHRPLQPASQQHRNFLQQHLEKTTALANRLPFLDLSAELKYFSSGVADRSWKVRAKRLIPGHCEG